MAEILSRGQKVEELTKSCEIRTRLRILFLYFPISLQAVYIDSRVCKFGKFISTPPVCTFINYRNVVRIVFPRVYCNFLISYPLRSLHSVYRIYLFFSFYLNFFANSSHTQETQVKERKIFINFRILFIVNIFSLCV